MDIGMCRACHVGIMLNILLLSHLATAFTVERNLQDLLLNNQDFPADNPGQRQGGGMVGRLHSSQNGLFAEHLGTNSRSSADMAKRNADLTNLESVNQVHYNDGYSSDVRGPVVYVRPSENTLPAVYWLSHDHTRLVGIGPRVVLNTDAHAHSSNPVARRTEAAQFDAAPTEEPSRSQRLTPVLSGANTISTDRNVSITGESAEKQSMPQRSHPASADLAQELYSTSATLKEISARSSFATTRRQDLHDANVVAGAGTPSETHYLIPDTVAPYSPSTPAPPHRNLILEAVGAMVTQRQSVMSLSPKSQTAGSVNLTNGRPLSAGGSLSRRRSVGGASLQYDDYQTPSPPVMNVTVQHNVHHAQPTLAPSTPHSAVNTQVPTAAPKPQAPIPTAAPIKNPPQHPISGVSTVSKPYVVPTLNTYHLNSFMAQPSVASGGFSGSSKTTVVRNAMQTPNPLPGRTTLLRNTRPTPDHLLMSNTMRPDVALGAGMGSGETVCVQYLSVQHDQDCNRRSRRDVMTPKHLTLLLQHHGGSASSPFTAASADEAESSFRNLMSLGSPETDEYVHLKFTARRIQTLLEKHYNSKSQSQSATSQPRSEKNNGSVPVETSGQHGTGHATWEQDKNGSGDDDLHLPVEFLDRMVPAKHVTFNHTARRTKRSFNPSDHHSYACDYSVNCQQFDSSDCPNGATEMALDDNGCDTCRCRDQDTIYGYCQQQTPSGSSQRAHLCTQCQQTRFLGNDVFPSYVQEVVCHPDNAPCLNIGNHGPQGLCQETRIPISVLRRNPGRCMRVQLINGQTFLFDDWRLSQILVRTGCQCTIDKRSLIAASLGMS